MRRTTQVPGGAGGAAGSGPLALGGVVGSCARLRCVGRSPRSIERGCSPNMRLPRVGRNPLCCVERVCINRRSGNGRALGGAVACEASELRRQPGGRTREPTRMRKSHMRVAATPMQRNSSNAAWISPIPWSTADSPNGKRSRSSPRWRSRGNCNGAWRRSPRARTRRHRRGARRPGTLMTSKQVVTGWDPVLVDRLVVSGTRGFCSGVTFV